MCRRRVSHRGARKDRPARARIAARRHDATTTGGTTTTGGAEAETRRVVIQGVLAQRVDEVANALVEHGGCRRDLGARVAILGEEEVGEGVEEGAGALRRHVHRLRRRATGGAASVCLRREARRACLQRRRGERVCEWRRGERFCRL